MIVKLKPVKQSRQNSETWPEFYTCRFLEPGIVSYEDVGAGIAMLRKETILKMMDSFKGKPIIDKRHVDVTEKNYEKHAVGYVTRIWYDDFANWACAEFILTDDEAKQSIKDGFFVSCAYDDCISGPGGEWHAIRYKEEILGGTGNHIALVDAPRYEGGIITPMSCPMLVNSRKAHIQKTSSIVTLTNATKKYTVTRKFTGGTLEGLEHTEETDVEFKEGQAVKNPIGGSPYIITRVVKNATKAPGQKQEKAELLQKRICDSCEYLSRNQCTVAGPGGKITKDYAAKRLNGLEQKCSAYEKSKEGRMNVTLKVAKNSINSAKKELIRLYSGGGWYGVGKEIDPNSEDWKALKELQSEGRAETKPNTGKGVQFRIK